MTGNLRLPLLVLFVLGLAAPFVLYPIFLMKVLCFALFACAYNLLYRQKDPRFWVEPA